VDFLLLMSKFKLYVVAILSAIFAGAVRAASKKRQGIAAGWLDTFYYIIMTVVVTGMCAGAILYLELPVNDDTLIGYGFLFVFIGQFTDLIYLKASEYIHTLSDKFIKKKG